MDGGHYSHIPLTFNSLLSDQSTGCVVAISHLLSGPVPTPKLASVVAGTGNQNMTKRMPGQIPDERIMGRLHSTYFTLITESRKKVNIR